MKRGFDSIMDVPTSVEQNAASSSGEIKNKKERLFEDIDAEQRVTEIESLCMNCHENVSFD
jgi:hypothetical protein